MTNGTDAVAAGEKETTLGRRMRWTRVVQRVSSISSLQQGMTYPPRRLVSISFPGQAKARDATPHLWFVLKHHHVLPNREE
jgi:hypothetical protein